MSYAGKGFVIDGYVNSTFGGYINITPSSGYFPNAFVVKVDSTNTTTGGTSSDQMGFYFEGAYDVTIYDDEGNSYSRSGTSSREDITFSTSGEHVCQIVDNGSSNFHCGIISTSGVTQQARDKDKYIEILQWGGGWDAKGVNDGNSFRGCSNLVSVSATDAPLLSAGNTASNFFNGCSSLVTLNGFDQWDFNAQTGVIGFFLGCSSIVQATDVTPQNVNNISSVTACWLNASEGAARFYFPSTATITGIRVMCQNIDADLSGHGLISWMTTADLAPTDTGNEFDGNTVGIGTANYDLILQQLDAGGTSNEAFDAGATTYTSAGAGGTARANLVSKGWTITDGGGV